MPSSTPAVQSLERGLALLLAFRQSAELSLAHLSQVLPIHRTSTYRLVRTLEARGFLVRDLESGQYRLGPALAELGGLALSRLEVRRVARPHLDRLAAETAETVQLLIRDGLDVVVVDGIESAQRVKVGAGIGERRPLHATAAGKCFLAGLSPDGVRALYADRRPAPLTSRTIVDVDTLLAEASRVGDTGFAVNDQESEPGVRFVAAPIIGPERSVIAALSLGAPAERLRLEDLAHIGRQLFASGLAISRSLGVDLTAGAV
ncbi:MAG TPA: IclR family transcriptional regulator [Chloroflexota bacterium]|nr:IclR family transcriptional regulator [Chloroflexota bacterium]